VTAVSTTVTRVSEASGEPGEIANGSIKTTGQRKRQPLYIRLIAIIALLVLGLRQDIGQGITLGDLLSVALLPVWLPVLKRYWGARILLAVGLLAAAAGIWLTQLAKPDHSVTSLNLVSNTALLVGALCGIGVVLWARTVLPDWAVGSVFGVALVLAVVTTHTAGVTNTWKFDYGIPVAIIVLSLFNRPGKRIYGVLALLGLALVSALQDSRSYFGEFGMAAVLIAWQARPWRLTRRSSAVVTLVVIGLIALLTYNIGSWLIVDGYLGSAAQSRSIAQIDTSGSLLLGGRPELAAAIALFLFNPWGFGAGVVPNLHELAVAKAGMAAINYNPNNGYVNNYMFGTKFEMHSILSDTWAYFGITGIVLIAIMIFLLLRTLGVTLAADSATAVVIFLCIYNLWNLFFSPLYSSQPLLMITFGLCLLPRTLSRDRAPLSQVAG
jgi:hypothetical protein